jgi:selenide,water dikinase
MIEGTDVGMIIRSAQIPFFPEVKELSEMGMVPGGLHRNREFRIKMVEIAPGVPRFMVDVMYDPQTSGGLLISVPEPEAETLVKRMHETGLEEAAVIGEVVAEPKGRIVVS